MKSFLGFGISSFTNAEYQQKLLSTVKNKETIVVYGHSLGSISLLKDIPEFYTYGNQADILVSDGRPFYYLARFSGIKLKSNISIPESVNISLQIASDNAWKVFLLGATKEINTRALNNLKLKYPGISVIGGNDGYFGEDDTDEIINKINNFSPDLLLIGISSPKKEIISIDWKQKLDCRVIIPCGGMIDVIAGKTRMAPSWIKIIGLASFYRLIQEPRRLGRSYLKIYFNIIFKIIPLVIWYMIVLRKKDFSLVKHYNIC